MLKVVSETEIHGLYKDKNMPLKDHVTGQGENQNNSEGKKRFPNNKRQYTFLY